jgi:hypothetical protein
MKQLHFSSHLAKEKDKQKKDPNLAKVFKFIKTIRNRKKEDKTINLLPWMLLSLVLARTFLELMLWKVDFF